MVRQNQSSHKLGGRSLKDSITSKLHCVSVNNEPVEKVEGRKPVKELVIKVRESMQSG